MKTDRLDVNHIVVCGQQTGIILRKNDDNSYYVELMNGEHRRMFLNEENVIPLSKKLLVRLGFIFAKPGMSACYSLKPLVNRPPANSGIPYCLMAIENKEICFECGEVENEPYPISTMHELQDYFLKKGIPMDFTDQRMLYRIAMMGMLTYSSKNPVGALTY